MPEGTCRLCGARAELRNSHIIPKWAYKRVLGDTGSPAPVLMTAEESGTTNFQFKEHMLCTTCEQRIGVSENVLSQLVVQVDRSFPLAAAVKPRPPPLDSVADASSVDVDTLASFGASVVFRMSVSKKHFPEVSLGTHESDFREYVLGRAPFPPHARLIVSLLTRPLEATRLDRSFSMPTCERVAACHLHSFTVHGVTFRMYVGKLLPEHAEVMCIVRNGLVALDTGERLHGQLLTMMSTSKVKGSLARLSKRPVS